jgi:hypothetical protein
MAIFRAKNSPETQIPLPSFKWMSNCRFVDTITPLMADKFPCPCSVPPFVKGDIGGFFRAIIKSSLTLLF